MLASLIAERYAKALLEAARQEKALEPVGEAAEALSQGLAGAPGSAAFLADPVAGREAKLKVLLGAFPQAPHAVFARFLGVVLEHKRERWLPGILAAFLDLRAAEQGLVQAGLGTAHALGEAELGLLGKALTERIGRSVALKAWTDPALLGGAVVRIGDKVYDGSLRAALKRLEGRLRQGPQERPKRAAAAQGGPAAAAKASPVKKKAAARAAAPKKKAAVPKGKAAPATKKKAAAKKKAAPKKKQTL